MHTLQDCYAHTLRSADGRTVYTVLNYIEAVGGTLNEARDGMAHSDALDRCQNAELAPLVARATAVSPALAVAVVALAVRWTAIAFDPLSLAIVAPVLQSPRIVQLEYRTLLGLELLP